MKECRGPGHQKSLMGTLCFKREKAFLLVKAAGYSRLKGSKFSAGCSRLREKGFLHVTKG